MSSNTGAIAHAAQKLWLALAEGKSKRYLVNDGAGNSVAVVGASHVITPQGLSILDAGGAEVAVFRVFVSFVTEAWTEPKSHTQ
ncbi:MULTISPECIES: hypothetical protein [Pseudomonas]|uniref:hypothetical protein n=1 Tax=Pseudomonas TaxID=286 RepID=UPI001A049176|nr:hypothetical protein [Pseudomonas lactis]MBA6043758.1 hypothetical protein [Pseudomonas lactis]